MYVELRKRLQYGFSIIIVAASIFVGITFYQQQQQQYAATPREDKTSAHAPLDLSINGFQYAANHDGHLSLQIRADRLVVKKKKVGMLRFGLLKEAWFTNARIELNSFRTKLLNASLDEKHTGQRKASAPVPEEDYSFKDAFKVESLASLPIKKVAAIHFAPIDLRLHVDGQLEASIKADSALMKTPTKEIHFSGNVLLNRGLTSIKSEYMVVSLEENMLLVPQEYRMSTRGKVIQGHDLRSDLLLNRITGTRPALVARAESTPLNSKIYTVTEEIQPHAENR